MFIGVPLALLLTIPLLLIAKPVEKDLNKNSCQPGKFWKIQCNECYCVDKGIGSCTKKPCESQALHKKIDTCLPGTSWMDGCNKCICYDFGKISCTMEECPPGYINGYCTPGSYKTADCNFCFCDEYGHLQCTMNNCSQLEKKEALHRLSQGSGYSDWRQTFIGEVEDNCLPGTSWSEDCQTCFCNEDNQKECNTFKCELSAQSIFFRGGCVPGSIWMERCNKCYCVKSGHPVCTKDECAELRHSISKCRPGSMKRYGCDVCYCTNEGGLACMEIKHCQPSKPWLQWRPASSLRSKTAGSIGSLQPLRPILARQPIIDCLSGAYSHLSELYNSKVVPQPPTTTEALQSPETTEATQPTVLTSTPHFTTIPQSTEADASTSFPQTTGTPQETEFPETTEPYETPLNNSYEDLDNEPSDMILNDVCVPGTVWTTQCNTCFCTDEGLPACTEKECPPELTSIQEEECQPGNTWTEECNVCICNENGQRCCTQISCNYLQAKQYSCEPGQIWIVDCNICVCNLEGFTSCSSAICPPQNPSTLVAVHGDERVPECEPFSEWVDNCNLCFCSANGYKYCTKSSYHYI